MSDSLILHTAFRGVALGYIQHTYLETDLYICIIGCSVQVFFFITNDCVSKIEIEWLAGTAELIGK